MQINGDEIQEVNFVYFIPVIQFQQVYLVLMVINTLATIDIKKSISSRVKILNFKIKLISPKVTVCDVAIEMSNIINFQHNTLYVIKTIRCHVTHCPA